MIKRKQFKALFLLGAIFILVALFVSPPAYALGNAFGGRVISKIPCTCDGVQIGSQVTIQGPGQSSGTYLDLSDIGVTRAFARYFISAGRRILGLSTPGGACMVGTTPPGCVDIGVEKTISRFGVSY